MKVEKTLQWIRLSLGGAVLGHSMVYLFAGQAHAQTVGALSGAAFAALLVRIFSVLG